MTVNYALVTELHQEKQKKQKYLRPQKLFKEMSKRLPVAGTLDSKPGSVGWSLLYSGNGHLVQFSPVQDVSFTRSPAWFYRLHCSGIRNTILALVSCQLICILKLVHFLDHCWTRQASACAALMGLRD